MKNLPGYVVAEKDPEIRRVVFESLSQEASNILTICEVLRFMYDTVNVIPDIENLDDLNYVKVDLKEKLIDAMNMAKKMDSRLSHYKRKYEGDKSGHAGSSLIKLKDTEERKRLRSSRYI